MARPASPEASACARIWTIDRETGASQRPGSLPALHVACRYSPIGFDRQHILARLVGPSSATTSTAGMTGPQNQAPVPPTTNPVTYEELTPNTSRSMMRSKLSSKPISSALSRGPVTTASGGRGSHPKALLTTSTCTYCQRSAPEPCARK